ncbi:MAG: hypothetical protein JNK58_11890 [Phycisphaerae bacterium]|nr:hypothetical protein [Phycisphaerae bacterium]
MVRAVLAVVAGYVAMLLIIFCVFTVAYLLMGADNAFRPGTYEPSPLWLVINFVLAPIAAVCGGLVCALIARPGSWAHVSLAWVVLALGLVMVLPVLTNSRPDPGPRTADVPNLEAMTKAKQPVWVAVANPIIGAAGVLLGARLRAPTKP